jgi:DNA-binding Lrp family transcriptional regulator
MGYKVYKFYFKLRNIPDEKEKFLEYIRKSGKIYWFGICSGKYDLIVAVYSKTDTNFLNIKNELISNFKNIIIDYNMDILVYTKQYAKMYFTNQIKESTYFGGEIVDNKLDNMDHKILEKIVNNSIISNYELSKQIETTPLTIRSKIKKLEKSGIIIQYRIGVNLNKLGLELYKAIISLEKYDDKIETEILKYVSNIPNISYYIKNIQRLELEFIVENFQQYYDIIENIKKKFPYIIKSVDVLLMLTDEWTPGFKNLLNI